MDNSTQLPRSNRFFIETDDLILTVNQDQIFFVHIVNQQKIQILGSNFNYSVPIQNNNIVPKLQESGFIRIKKSFYINPLQISEYNIKNHELKFSNGDKIFISHNSSKNLIHYFAENQLDKNENQP